MHTISTLQVLSATLSAVTANSLSWRLRRSIRRLCAVVIAKQRSHSGIIRRLKKETHIEDISTRSNHENTTALTQLKKTTGGVRVWRVLKQARRKFIKIINIKDIFNKHMSKAALGYVSELTEHKQQRWKGCTLNADVQSCSQRLWLEVFDKLKSRIRGNGLVHVYWSIQEVIMK